MKLDRRLSLFFYKHVKRFLCSTSLKSAEKGNHIYMNVLRLTNGNYLAIQFLYHCDHSIYIQASHTCTEASLPSSCSAVMVSLLEDGLIKTTSIEQVVAPIATHLCHLILLCESGQEPERFARLEAAAQAVAKAARHMATVASR